MDNILNQTIGQLVAEQPGRAAVFDSLGIDYCCGGKATLAQACQSQKLDRDIVTALLYENDRALKDRGEGENWQEASVTALTDHIEQCHHAYLKKELPRLNALSQKVAAVHGAKDSRLQLLAKALARTSNELLTHALKEEQILFPYIRKLDAVAESLPPPFGTVANPINCLEKEHSESGDALSELRALTDNYNVPAGACASWNALMDGLSQLDTDLRTHIHKENSILFPKVLKLEQSKIRELSGSTH